LNPISSFLGGHVKKKKKKKKLTVFQVTSFFWLFFFGFFLWHILDFSRHALVFSNIRISVLKIVPTNVWQFKLSLAIGIVLDVLLDQGSYFNINPQ